MQYTMEENVCAQRVSAPMICKRKYNHRA